MSTDDDRSEGSRRPAEDRQPVAHTKHTELTLDQIGGLMPGLGSLMPIISDRFGWAFHAAVDDANRIPGETGYGYIVYKIPEEGPPHMSVEPPGD